MHCRDPRKKKIKGDVCKAYLNDSCRLPKFGEGSEHPTLRCPLDSDHMNLKKLTPGHIIVELTKDKEFWQQQNQLS